MPLSVKTMHNQMKKNIYGSQENLRPEPDRLDLNSDDGSLDDYGQELIKSYKEQGKDTKQLRTRLSIKKSFRAKQKEEEERARLEEEREAEKERLRVEEELRKKEEELNKKDRTEFSGLKDSEIDEYIDKIVQKGDSMDPKEMLPKNLKIGEVVNEVAQLGVGDAFGELALIYDKPRMATVKCIERSHFIVLSKTEYNGALSEIERRK